MTAAAFTQSQRPRALPPMASQRPAGSSLHGEGATRPASLETIVAQTTEPRTELPAQRQALEFVVGQDRFGAWVAVEAHGLAGGVFVSRDAAVRYVASECGKRRDAVRVESRPLASLI